MEDHTTTCRLAVTASFARGMSNFHTIPDSPAGTYDCTLYHALPHGLKDPLRKTITAGAFVNTTSVQQQKMEALKAHQSQQAWLHVSQGLNSYLQTMEDVSLKVGKMSGKFTYAEGWRRHLHYGFCSPDDDPLAALGDDYLINKEYEQSLEPF
jgi:LmbE family N-acetylglucosaminyl deacetylase